MLGGGEQQKAGGAECEECGGQCGGKASATEKVDAGEGGEKVEYAVDVEVGSAFPGAGFQGGGVLDDEEGGGVQPDEGGEGEEDPWVCRGGLRFKFPGKRNVGVLRSAQCVGILGSVGRRLGGDEDRDEAEDGRGYGLGGGSRSEEGRKVTDQIAEAGA